ncbi:transporter [Haoranjiania flava]|uniref:Transporter n=1 Tax=Haoranjiania flava TaxID=1856322 RepID=A0AAE3IL94_9BACT|nr:transporter [Haoranjiania flava]MCU7693888.1 transporter [Haoranjiania flava]
MKKFFIPVLLFLFFAKGFSQTEKGRFALSGATNLGFLSSTTSVAVDSGRGSAVKTKTANLQAAMAYFIVKDLAVGINGGIVYNRTEPDNNSPYFHNWSASVVPSITYFIPVGGRLRPQLSAGAGYTWVFKDKTDAEGITFHVSPAVSYFPNRNFSFDLGVQYAHLQLKDKETGNSSQTQNIIGLAAGVSVYF